MPFALGSDEMRAEIYTYMYSSTDSANAAGTLIRTDLIPVDLRSIWGTGTDCTPALLSQL